MTNYKYTLNEDLFIYYKDLNKNLQNRVFDELSGTFENDFLKVDIGRIIVKKGYSWDGATPKFKVGNILIGTWDGFTMKNKQSQLYIPTALHDSLYQFLGEHSLSRKTADLIFLQFMQKNRFIFQLPYYVAVRLLGGIYKRITKKLK